jgi:hypothetical protein
MQFSLYQALQFTLQPKVWFTIFLFIAGLAVPTIQQFLDNLTISLTCAAFPEFQISQFV